MTLKCFEEKKSLLCQQLKEKRSGSCQNLALGKETSNLFRTRKENVCQKIDVRNFCDILEVDETAMIANVEGMTTYEKLVQETLKHGSLPAVVPELKSITIGGAISGLGIESSSFRYGLVHETIQEMEVLLSSGDVVIAKPEGEFSDLFFALPNSYGSLGYILRAKLSLVKAKSFVKLVHKHFADHKEYFQELGDLSLSHKHSKGFSFIEGVIFSPKKMYITTGEFTSTVPYESNYQYKNIYYHSLEEKTEDYLATSDYIWRWDTDWFWCSKVFGLENPALRRLLGKMYLNSMTYTRIMRFLNRHTWLSALLSKFQNYESVIQDILIPLENAESFFSFMQENIGIFPIWICPTQTLHETQRAAFCPLKPNTLYLDFGFWSSIKSTHPEGFYNRKIEEITESLSGLKSLYSASYYTKEEFWKIYDKKSYMELKKKYDPKERLSSLYEKTKALSR